MKNTVLSILALFGAVTSGFAQAPDMPKPTKEHEWLQQFVGEWDTAIEIFMDPAQPPMKGKGTETSRSLGGFWVVAEGQSEMMGMKFGSVLTLGYDPDKKKYIGTWVDSMASHLWKYEGSVDATGKILTLDTEGPCPMRPGVVKFKEVTELKDKDTRVFTSSIVEADGKLTQMIRVTSTRKK
jgi:hypothetical protein